MKRKSCLICNNPHMIKILDLGSHAYADTFIPEERVYDKLPVYKLACALCEICGQIQTISQTNAVERYGLYNYSYTSANSDTSRKHWKKCASTLSENLGLSKDAHVIEIGSNDGFLLKQFKERGNNVLGVDASPYVTNIAIQQGIPTVVSIFDNNIAETMKEDTKQEADLVVANNVFNHSEDPFSFALGANKLLKRGGYFVYELPYWLCSVESGKIDQVYHEHVSYFTVRSSAEIMDRTGFNIVNVEVVDYHGGSLRVYAQKRENDFTNHNDMINEMIEKESFLFTIDTYHDIMKELERRKYHFLNEIALLKSAGENIVAIGAAAKGNTFLNFLNLDNSIIDYVTDASTHKQGKYTPLSNIPITGDDILSTYDKVYAIILSWNLASKIKPKLKEINPNIKFLDFYEE